MKLIPIILLICISICNGKLSDSDLGSTIDSSSTREKAIHLNVCFSYVVLENLKRSYVEFEIFVDFRRHKGKA